jgi:hypothetical protein
MAQRAESKDVEVTPAMIEAGASVAARYVDMEWEALRNSQRTMVLTEIFKAMLRAVRRSPSGRVPDPYRASAISDRGRGGPAQ